MPENGGDALVPPPPVGRIYEASRLVRFGDLTPGGRLRLDAVARYLQDVSGDDTADAGFEDLVPWVVRRQVIEVAADAGFREALTLRTWCSGTGPRWAERRISIVGAEGAHLEAVVLWVHVEPETGQPRKLSEDFFRHYGEAAGDRRVRARLSHDPQVPPRAVSRSWPLRFADFDLFRHVNNAVYLQAVEEELGRRRDLRAPLRIEVEYRAGIGVGEDVTVSTVATPDGLELWLAGAGSGEVFATARVLVPEEVSGGPAR